MKLGTRLLASLVPIVVLIMSVYAAWALVEREQTVTPESRQEVQAYATALGLAFDLALRDVQPENVQSLLNQVSRAPTVFGVLVYDAEGNRTFASDSLKAPSSPPRDVLRSVIATGTTAAFEREIDDQRVYSVLRAIRGSEGRPTGALEVAQPLASVVAEKALVRRRFVLNTLTLLAALIVATLWLVRRVVAQPMGRLVEGARALGGGNLAHRVAEDPGGGELATLAREFNGMAERLQSARAAADREAEGRVALERELRRAEKMAAIGTLAAGVAHEIAAPLNVISGRAELLLDRDPDAATRTRNLQIIVRQINRITTIVKDLLGYAKRREPVFAAVELGTVVDGALELLEGELERAGVTVRRENGAPLPVRGDADQLHQVLVNLVLNAVQAMEGRERPELTVRLARADGQAVLEIEDRGPGIDAGIEARLFEPFASTKPGGTGLGLAVAKSLIEEHGGRLEGRNGPTGAIFRVLIPLDEGSRSGE